ncbi:MAG: alpha/beta fold hydrolase [Cycloclasticus sp.]
MVLNFTEQGNAGPPLIILHGLFGSARNWQGIARQLAERYTVYALDLRNHGSSPHDEVMDYAAMSADVIEFIDQHRLQQPIVLGHSLGGKVAMQLALSEPAKLSKLIIVDIAPVRYTHNFDEVLLGFSHVPLDSIKSRKEADSYLAEKINSVSLRQFLLQNLINNASGGYQWRVNLASIEANMDTIMGFPEQQLHDTFNKASLFIKGGKSTYLAPRYKALIDERFPEAEWQTIANTGHWPHIESPVDFMAGLNKFLSA